MCQKEFPENSEEYRQRTFFVSGGEDDRVYIPEDPLSKIQK